MHKLHDAHDSLRHCIWTTRGCCEDVADPVTRDTVARDAVAGQAAPSDAGLPLDAVERPAGDTVASDTDAFWVEKNLHMLSADARKRLRTLFSRANIQPGRFFREVDPLGGDGNLPLWYRLKIRRGKVQTTKIPFNSATDWIFRGMHATDIPGVLKILRAKGLRKWGSPASTA